MSNTSHIHLKIILREDVPNYIKDFFSFGTKHIELPTVLYSYGFNFDNTCNFESNRFMLFQRVGNNYHLQIEYQFDFDNEDEVSRGYWFVGGLAQFAKDNLLAGYIKHTHISHQLFGFKNQLPFWLNGVEIDFGETE
jgi:hypothetical protein